MNIALRRSSVYPLAECMNNPKERAEMLRFARMWMNLAEPIEEFRGAYELPRHR